MALMEIARKHGKLSGGLIKSKRLYARWNVMRRRCYDPSFIVFPYYGGKGIEVCPEWRNNYLEFQAWAMSHGWKPELTLDRLDSHGNYTPENCRWITLAEQQCNRSEWNIEVTIDGRTDLLCHWAARYKVPESLVSARIRRLKWDPVRAVTTPSSHNGRKLLTVDGESKTLYMWAKELNMSRSRLYEFRKVGKNLKELIRNRKKGLTNVL